MIQRNGLQPVILAAIGIGLLSPLVAGSVAAGARQHGASEAMATELGPQSIGRTPGGAAADDEAAFETMFEGLRRGAFRPALNALETEFPEDFEALKREIRDAFHNGRSPSEIVWSRTALGRVVIREMPAILRAPDDYLIDYLIANRDAYAIAARDMPELCNQISAGVFRFAGPPSPELARAMSRNTASLIHAAAASRVRPVERDLGPLTEEELTRWIEEMVQLGMTAEDAELIDNPSAMAAADPAQTCRIRQMLIDAALELPAPTAARFSAGMLSTTIAQRQP